MSALKELAKRQPKIASFLSTAICVGIVVERAKSFAEAQQPASSAVSEKPTQIQSETRASDKGPKGNPPSPVPSGTSQGQKLDLPLPAVPAKSGSNDSAKLQKSDLLHTVPLELRAVQKFDNIKTKQQACAILEGKVVTYYDSATLVQNCIQRPIEDADLLNELIYKQRKAVAEIPAHVYRLIPFGEPWTANQNQGLTVSKVCRELNGKYVTSTGTDYYFIEACKKRPFANYVELQAHNKRNEPVLSVTPDQIEKIPTGRQLEGNYDREVSALYKIVGDSSLSPLSTDNDRAKPVTSAEELEALPQKSGKQNEMRNICRELNQKVVSYYSQLFFISNCQKRPVKELPISIQQRFAERGISIVDVSSRQLNSIPTGKDLSEEDALELIK